MGIVVVEVVDEDVEVVEEDVEVVDEDVEDVDEIEFSEIASFISTDNKLTSLSLVLLTII